MDWTTGLLIAVLAIIVCVVYAFLHVGALIIAPVLLAGGLLIYLLRRDRTHKGEPGR